MIHSNESQTQTHLLSGFIKYSRAKHGFRKNRIIQLETFKLSGREWRVGDKRSHAPSHSLLPLSPLRKIYSILLILLSTCSNKQSKIPKRHVFLCFKPSGCSSNSDISSFQVSVAIKPS